MNKVAIRQKKLVHAWCYNYCETIKHSLIGAHGKAGNENGHG